MFQEAPGKVFAFLLLLLASLLYFVDTLLRASLKLFWFDELYTVYLCRLPSFHQTWTAVLAGADFNPPLFYLLTRWSQVFTGEGLIMSRLPQILAFWIFCGCLYLFTSRRLGFYPALVAALVPCFTLAQYYAYEARPTGIVLGFSGLMLLCWQRDQERSASSLWALGFGLSFLGALLTHVYAVYLAVPFAAGEAVRILRRRPVRYRVVVAGVLPLACVLPLYLHMMRAFHAMVRSRQVHPDRPNLVADHFLRAAFGPSLLIFLLLLATSAIAFLWKSPYRPAVPFPHFTSTEVVVALGLLFAPLIGIATLRFAQTPYFDRYFLTAAAGLALLLAQATVGFASGSRIAQTMAAVMLGLLALDTCFALYCRVRPADPLLIEPNTLIQFPPNPKNPLALVGILPHDHGTEDIMITEWPTYLYLRYYAPPELTRRLYYVDESPSGMFLWSYQKLSTYGGVTLQLSTVHHFLLTHNQFTYFHAMPNRSCLSCEQLFLENGFFLRSVQREFNDQASRYGRGSAQ